MTTKEKKTEAKTAVSPGMGAILHKGGVTFRVWAPHAEKVWVTGSFNDWSETQHALKHEGDGYWAGTITNVKARDEYKYVLQTGQDKLWRNDPYARELTSSVGNSIVCDLDFAWDETIAFEIPAWNELVIYEMHVGTFNDNNPDDGKPGNFMLAAKKLPYLRELGVNAVQIMPPMEFPGGISWGYNPSYPFAIEKDYGGVVAFKTFVQAAHAHGIAVLVDVVYNHFGPGDLDLWRFDGWSENGGGGIYFYNDGRVNTPWGDTRPDYGRTAVRQYLRDNALMWLDEYRVDGLRWDATAFIRNIYGHNNSPATDLPDGWSLMQWINDEIDARSQAKITIAEDLQGNEWITKDTGAGGAGFSSQWDSNFVHPVRTALVAQDDAFRDLTAVAHALDPHYGDDIFHRVIYTESHDEVANGKARIPEEIWPGQHDSWFSKKRSTLGAALVFTAPGIPMIFQGQELLAGAWFDDNSPLDWQAACEQSGIAWLYQRLIHLRRNAEGNTAGLLGQHLAITHLNNEAKLLAYHRWAGEGGAGNSVMVVLNFANHTITDYTIGFPQAGLWQLRFDSHASVYDPAFEGQVSGDVQAADGEYDGLPAHGTIQIAPYSALILSQ